VIGVGDNANAWQTDRIFDNYGFLSTHLVHIFDQSAGNQAYTYTLSYAPTSTPLTATIAAVASPRDTNVDQMTITFSQPVSGFTLADLQLSLNGGANLLTASQTLTPSANNTVWTLSGLTSLTNTNGTYTLALSGAGISDAAGGELSGDATSSFTLSMAPTLSLPVNSGAAERSMVTSVTLAFSQPVTIDPAGVTIAVPDGQTGTVPTISLQTNDGGLNYTATFSGNGVVGGSIADGVYRLTVAANAATAAGGIHLASDVSLTFLRLFGDISGNGIVNNADLFQLRSAYATAVGDAAYLPGFDYNGNGLINNADLFQIRSRYGEVLTLGGSSNNQAAAPAVLPADQDFIDPADVDASGQVTPLDALLIINAMNSNSGPFIVPADAISGPTSNYYDVNGDGLVSPLDALLVLNELNATVTAAAQSAAPPSAAAVPSAATLPAALPATMPAVVAAVGIAPPLVGGSLSTVAETLASQSTAPAGVTVAIASPSAAAPLAIAPTLPASPVSSIAAVQAPSSETVLALEGLANDSDEDLDSLISLLATAQVAG
jgi:hypothetical protein